MSVVHFHNIILGKPACLATQEMRGLLLTLMPEKVTCSGCISYLQGGRGSESASSSTTLWPDAPPRRDH